MFALHESLAPRIFHWLPRDIDRWTRNQFGSWNMLVGEKYMETHGAWLTFAYLTLWDGQFWNSFSSQNWLVNLIDRKKSLSHREFIQVCKTDEKSVVQNMVPKLFWFPLGSLPVYWQYCSSTSFWHRRVLSAAMWSVGLGLLEGGHIRSISSKGGVSAQQSWTVF